MRSSPPHAVTAFVYPVMVLLLGLVIGGTSTGSSTLDNLNTVASMLQAFAAAAAVVVGGIWTYYRFIKDRTYKPRFAVEINVVDVPLDGRHGLHCRMSVKNIGNTSSDLRQYGTGLRITGGHLATANAYDRPEWRNDGATVFDILDHDSRLEPGEQVAHEVMVPKLTEDELWLVEVRMVFVNDNDPVQVYAHKIVPPFDDAPTASLTTGGTDG